MNKIVRDKHTCIIREDAIIDNPLISASYVLGIVAEASQWRDEKGRNLLDFYPELAQLHRKEEEKKQEREGNEKKRRVAILNIVKSIELYIKIKEQRHIFCIEEKGVCKAEGYFDPESRYFFITRGSLVARESDIIYANCPSGKSRLRFLDKVCVLQQCYYLVKKDAKCRSATAAACYVLGHFASYVNWKDKDGKHLNEVFPNVSFNVDPDVQGDNSKSFNSTDQHVFYIIRNNGSKRACHATGKYDATNNKFIILKDSVLSLDIAWSYSSSPSDTMRRNFIKQHCVKQHNGYVVIKDAICDSPSAAASFILGRNANGWSEWKDKENRTMKDVLKNSFCQ